MRCYVAGVVLCALVAAGCSSVWHGDPDPGRRIYRVVAPVLHAVPAGSRIDLSLAGLPEWDSCAGRDGTEGWSDFEFSVDFTTSMRRARVRLVESRKMTQLGWVRRDIGDTTMLAWKQNLRNGRQAHADLFVSEVAQTSTGHDSVQWELEAQAPPATHPVTNYNC